MSVSWPRMPITLHVAGPTTPSTASPWRPAGGGWRPRFRGRIRRRPAASARSAGARRRSALEPSPSSPLPASSSCLLRRARRWRPTPCSAVPSPRSARRPSAGRRCRRPRARCVPGSCSTAASVSGPKTPSTPTPPSALLQQFDLTAFAAFGEDDRRFRSWSPVRVAGRGRRCAAAGDARASGRRSAPRARRARPVWRASRPGRTAARRRGGVRASVPARAARSPRRRGRAAGAPRRGSSSIVSPVRGRVARLRVRAATGARAAGARAFK